MTRRLFAFVLALLMLFSSVPTQALADMLPESSNSGEVIYETETGMEENADEESEEATDSEEPQDVPEEEETPDPERQVFCGMEPHAHDESCADDCEIQEHAHSDSCYEEPVKTRQSEESEETEETEQAEESEETEESDKTEESEKTDESEETEETEETEESEETEETEEPAGDVPMLFGLNRDPDASEEGASTFAFDRNTGMPTDLANNVYLAVYSGDDFPGEPAWYSEAGYYFFNGSFTTQGVGRATTYASRAQNVLKPEILSVLTQGAGSGSVKVWGYYSATGTKDFFVEGSALLNRSNEEKIIRAVKGSNVDVDNYEIIWYVIKFQTDTYWHIDGLVVKRDTYNVNYYGNGNTGGGAPNGATGLLAGNHYTVLGNVGNLVKVVNGEEYTFSGWNTKADGTGTAYKPDDVIVISGNVSLYAQWEPPVKDTITDEVGSVIIHGSKIWQDNNNADKSRPGSITVNLYANGTKIGTTTAYSPNYTYSFNVSALAQEHNISNIVDAELTIGEEAVPGYTLTEVKHPDVVFVDPASYGNAWEKIAPCDKLDYQNTANGKTVVAAKMTSSGVVVVWSADALAQFERDLIEDSLRMNADGLGNPKSFEFLSGEGASSTYGITVDSANVMFDGTSAWSMFFVGTYKRGESGTTDAVLTNTFADTSVYAQKVWDDDHNRDGKRPDSVTIQLLANGSVVDTADLTSDKNWTKQWQNLPKYAQGVEINYTIQETNVPEGYTASYDQDETGRLYVTNKYVPETTSITATKVWNDNSDQDGKRPEEVILTVYADGVSTGKTVKVTGTGNTWTATVDDLTKYVNENGTVREIVYSLVEETANIPEGYTPVTNGLTVTNSYTPETIDISFTKVWEDNNDQDGKRPDKITVNLLADGVKVDSVTVDAKSHWAGTFQGVAKYKDGKQIVYTISEDAVDGYETKVEGDTITNSYTPETADLTVVKTWNDFNNNDGTRPYGIVIELYENGTGTGKKVTLTADNNWTDSWRDMPIYKNGQRISYTTVEVGYYETKDTYKHGVAPGYTVSHDNYDLVKHISTVTNSYTPATTGLNVQKHWEDNNDQDGLRPESITFYLWMTTDETKLNLVPSEENGWEKVLDQSGAQMSVVFHRQADDTWTDVDFTNLHKFHDQKTVYYTVTEAPVDGYETTYDLDEANGVVTVTNTHTPATTSVTVTKVWEDNNNQDGKRPASVTVNLYGRSKVEPLETVTLTAENGWTYTWTDLAQKYNGVDITYTVREITDAAVASIYTPSYEETATTTVITNTHTPETTSVSFQKVWDDNLNQDGVRPTSVTVNLLADGEKVTSKTVTAEHNWSGTFTNLPKYKDGVEIRYTVSEDAVEGYTAEINGTTITNTHEVEKTQFTVTKVWEDNNNQDGKRPVSVEVTLYANNVQHGKTVTLNEKNGWTYTWTGLDKKSGGRDIVYRVDEAEVPGYTKSINGGTITNTHTPETISVTVTKVWNDNNDQDGKRPMTITLRLWANGAEKQVAETYANKDWSHTFTNLPKYAGGQEIVYTVTEDAVEGYTTTVDGYTVTNTHTPETISIPFTKEWNDSNNQDGKRPGAITVNLMVGGEEIAEKTVTANDNWSGTFENLPKYENGTEIVYSLTEDAVEGYTTVVRDGTIINTHVVEKTSVTVTKTWADNDDQDGKRPASITVNLLADGVGIAEKTVTDANGWQAVFADLDKYANGKEIVYTVTEEAVAGYTTTIDGFAITNTHTPETVEVRATKNWEDGDNQDKKRPAQIELHLLADGKHTEQKAEVREGTDGKWTASWGNLPKYNNGKLINYTVTEAEILNTDGVAYDVIYHQGSNGADTQVIEAIITNKLEPEKTAVTVEKLWDDAGNQDGIRPDEIQVQLFKQTSANGAAVKVGEPVMVRASEGWIYTFEDLDKYADGFEIVYTVEEVNTANGYEASNGSDAITGNLEITNKHTPEVTSVTVTKTWVDNDNQDGKRPQSITVNLLANGKTRASRIITAENNWQHTFTDLPKYADGNEIVYTITENPVTDYTTSIEGFDITNTHEIEKTDFTATKVWNDNNNQDGIRPEAVEVALYANGKLHATVELKEANNWSYTWIGLDKYAAGEEIAYTVDEVTVSEGYSKKVEGSTITNTHVPATIEVTATKVWNDADNQDGKRPEKITLHLLANGVHTGKHVELDGSEGWSYTWTGLDQFEGGKEIVYHVQEEEAGNGYSTTYSEDRFTVTNTYAPEKTSVNVWKDWNDANDQDGIRPEFVTVKLLANDKEIETANITAEGNWQHSFTNLNKYANGQLISYTIEEIKIDGYETTYSEDGYTITNTHVPATTEVTVTKIWDDKNDQDGFRPDSVTLYLYGRDKQNALYKRIVRPNAEGEWTYTWTGLPKFYNGTEIIYTVREEAVTDETGRVVYTPTYEETATTTVITNTHIPETTSVSFRKIWNDNLNQDGKRPASITVNLLASGEEIDEMTVTAAENWSGTFADLDKYADGTEIVYTITEDPIAEYTTRIDGTTITNTHIPATRDLAVRKIWDDFNNNDGKRPHAVIVTLLDNGTAAANVDPLVLTAANGWQGSWNNMPEYRGGQHISYTVVESGVYMKEGDTEITPVAETGYTVTHGYDTTDPENPVATITNKYTPETTGLNVQKVWDDDDNREGKRPDKIVVTLYRKVGENGAWEEMYNSDGTPMTAVLTAENEWDADFTGLPAYSNQQKISYKVVEAAVDGYGEPEYVLDQDANLVTITNPRTINKNVSVTVTKDWQDEDNQDGIRPEKITVRLYANGIDTGETKDLSEDNNWTATWEGLYDYYKGKQIVYTVDEEAVPAGYTKTVTTTRQGDAVSVVIANKHEPEKISIPVFKIWDDNGNQDGIRPEKVVLKLMANGEPTGKTLELDAADNWQGVFEDLDKNSKGTEIQYSVVENQVDGYNVDENGNAQNATAAVVDGKLTVTNVHKIEKTTMTVKKVWDDDNDRDGNRPASITFHLLADGVHMGEAYKAVLTADTGWTYTWTGLDKNSAGQAIRYTVFEEVSTADTAAEAVPESHAVHSYTVSYVRDSDTLVTVTNSYIPETTSYSVSKIWEDDDNRDAIRPASLTVKLLANGQDTGKTLVLTEENNWSGEWTDLFKYEDHGKLITYSAEEETPNGYTGEITQNGNAFTLTNTHAPATTNVEVTKIWDDEDNNDGKRPDGIVVQLYANGVLVEGRRETLDEQNKWTHVFESTEEQPLYIYEQGEMIHYYVAEVGYVIDGEETAGLPDGYEGSTEFVGDGYTVTITNTHITEKLDLTVEKQWNDNDNNDGFRPASVQVTLVKNGTDVETVTLNQENQWKHTWTDLYKYAGGVEVAYTLRETAVEHYTDSYSYQTSEDGKTIQATVVNTHADEKINVAVTKVWEDTDNNDGYRPEAVQVTLVKNGTDVETVVLNKDNAWAHTWTDLNKYAEGTEISYTVRENAVRGYETSYSSELAEDGKTISIIVTNTHEIETRKVTVNKVWKDKDNAEGLRPLYVTVQLYKNGRPYGSKIILSSTNRWKEQVELPVYENGWRIDWTIKELNIPRYYSVSYDQHNLTVTNTIQSKEVPKTGDYSMTSMWYGLLALCGAGTAGVLFFDKKKKTK